MATLSPPTKAKKGLRRSRHHYHQHTNIQTLGSQNRMQVDMENAQGIMQVTAIVKSSPADDGGLKCGDIVTHFGHLSRSNWTALAVIIGLIRDNPLQPISVTVLRPSASKMGGTESPVAAAAAPAPVTGSSRSRAYTKVSMTLVPAQWSGGGVLGCVLNTWPPPMPVTLPHDSLSPDVMAHEHHALALSPASPAPRRASAPAAPSSSSSASSSPITHEPLKSGRLSGGTGSSAAASMSMSTPVLHLGSSSASRAPAAASGRSGSGATRSTQSSASGPPFGSAPSGAAAAARVSSSHGHAHAHQQATSIMQHSTTVAGRSSKEQPSMPLNGLMMMASAPAAASASHLAAHSSAAAAMTRLRAHSIA